VDKLFLQDLTAVEMIDAWVARASVGLGFLDEERRYVRVNDALARLHGLAPEDHVGRRVDEVSPDLAAEVRSALDRVLRDGEVVTDVPIDASTLPGSGAAGFWSGNYYPLLNADGRVRGVVCIVAELAEAGQTSRQPEISEQGLRLALAGTETGLWEWDIAPNKIRWSDKVGPLHGLPFGAQPADYESYLSEAVHPEDRDRLNEAVERAVRYGEGYELELRVNIPDGDVRWLATRAHVVFDPSGRPAKLVGITYDVTERKRREDELAFLSEASDSLAQSLDPLQTLQEITRLAVPGLADWCVVQLVSDDGTLETLAAEHVDRAKLRRAIEAQTRYPPDPAATSGVPQVVRTGRAEFYPEITDDLLVAGAVDDDHLQLLRDLQMRSAIIVPLLARGRALGAITFIYAESGREYGARELELAEELGRRAGVAIDNATEYARERRTAEILQRALLPHEMPTIPGYVMATAYVPGTAGDNAGGDWYDAFPLPNGRYGLTIGDVVGRGIDAAATMGQARNALRAYALTAEDPGEVMHKLAVMASWLGEMSFVTAIFTTLDARTGLLRYVSAGHPPPLLIPLDGGPRYLELATAPPLGRFAEAEPPRASQAQLDPGDTLVFYTDGLVEHRGRTLDDGMQRLLELVRYDETPDALIARLLGLMADDASEDDIAVVALRREPSPARA
jgi:PAS domain S-box-containing protein